MAQVHSTFGLGPTEDANREHWLWKSSCGWIHGKSWSLKLPFCWALAGMLHRIWVSRMTSFGPDADFTGSPHLSPFLSSPFYSHPAPHFSLSPSTVPVAVTVSPDGLASKMNNSRYGFFHKPGWWRRVQSRSEFL